MVSGTGKISAKRCGPGDQCPNRRSGYCGGFHPVRSPLHKLYVDDIAAQVPAGELVPMRYRLQGKEKGDAIYLVTPKDKALYEELTGRPSELVFHPAAERTPRRPDNRRIDCAGDAGSVVAQQNELPDRSDAPPDGEIPAECRQCHQPLLLHRPGRDLCARCRPWFPRLSEPQQPWWEIKP